MRRSAPRWIPASPLLAGLAFQLVAWVIVGAHALRPAPGLVFAWIHAVALGWLTTVALSILIHVLPAQTNRAWRFGGLARGALAGVAGGAALVVCGFVWNVQLLAVGAVVAASSIAAYALAAARTLSGKARSRREAAVASALAATLGALVLAAAFGVLIAVRLARGEPLPVALARSMRCSASSGGLPF